MERTRSQNGHRYSNLKKQRLQKGICLKDATNLLFSYAFGALLRPEFNITNRDSGINSYPHCRLATTILLITSFSKWDLPLTEARKYTRIMLSLRHTYNKTYLNFLGSLHYKKLSIPARINQLSIGQVSIINFEIFHIPYYVHTFIIYFPFTN